MHLAIAAEILPKAPDTMEMVPGDRGYFGSDQIYARWAAVQSGGMDAMAKVAEARALVLDTLRPWMAQVVELAAFGKSSGYVSDEMVRASII